MEIRVLQYFLAVAREQSISRAAESLNLTQPTLSRQLKDLEDEFGKQLLVRGNRNRKVTLTEEGVFLQKRAQEILDLANKTVADLCISAEIISGEVLIGAGETDVMRTVARIIKTMRNDYPHISYQILSGNAELVTERLEKGLLDFGLLIGNVDLSKYKCLRLPGMDRWGLLMRKDSELAAFPSIKPEQLQNIPLLCSKQAIAQNELSSWFGGDFEKLNIIITYNLINNAALMVEEGVGYAVCLEKLVNTTGDSNLCFRPLEPRFESHLYNM
jgi:DNA-binding transcriptional LysR family regulator